jgi:hypothetical protein
MRSLTQLTQLINVRPRPAPAAVPEERLHALFRNRAELKKAYSELQDEVYRLQDRIKQQEGATARVQEMLGALESRLGLAETAYPALVFYQLRALWQCGREIVEQFVSELANQQEERERRAHVAEGNRRQFARRQAIETHLREAETQLATRQQHCLDLAKERGQLTRFWHYFKRRELERRVRAAAAEVSEAEEVLNAARAAAQQLQDGAAPQFPGLSIEARRAINLAAIAYAEVLCARVIDTPLVSLAKEATSRRESGNDYGERPACEALITQIAAARTLLQSKSNVAQDVKARTERLKGLARYRNPNDTSPIPESLAFAEDDVLAGQTLGGASLARMPNVLAEDTWDLFRILLR